MKYNMVTINELIIYGIDRNWGPQVIRDTIWKSFKINIRLSYILRFYANP